MKWRTTCKLNVSTLAIEENTKAQLVVPLGGGHL